MIQLHFAYDIYRKDKVKLRSIWSIESSIFLPFFNQKNGSGRRKHYLLKVCDNKLFGMLQIPEYRIKLDDTDFSSLRLCSDDPVLRWMVKNLDQSGKNWEFWMIFRLRKLLKSEGAKNRFRSKFVCNWLILLNFQH